MRTKPTRVRNGKYLSHVRTFGCLVCGKPAQAHHARVAEFTGQKIKVGDNYTVPLCAVCHNNLHGFGDEQTWWDMLGIDPLAWADKTWREWQEGNDRGNHG